MPNSWPEVGPEGAPLRSKMEPPEWYEELDPGIRFAVRVLHAKGIETGQSCQGGEGHCYPEPTVDLTGGGYDNPDGFAALAALRGYGLPVSGIAIHWNVSAHSGLPFERFWRITFSRACPERADEIPMFIWGYQAATCPPTGGQR